VASFPPVQSVVRAFALLRAVNQRHVSTVGDLHKDTGLPKPTIVRLLNTLVGLGYVANDKLLGGYCVTSLAPTLSAGFHGAPMVVEAARPWCSDLTRRLKWPVAIAMLDDDAVAVRFSTIPDSPMSPFHATLNMRLSLVSRALGRAYLASCPRGERDILMQRLRKSTNPEDRPANLTATVAAVRAFVKKHGYAMRDPRVEPTSSSTIAMPIVQEDRVLATIGLTYFRSAVSARTLREVLVPSLRAAVEGIEASCAILAAGTKGIASDRVALERLTLPGAAKAK
jgi:IclR family transcriptional regulator, mhp operon transcriptional activator